MKCDTDKIIDWLNGQLPKAEEKGLDMHIAECETCKDELEKAKKIMQFLQQISVPAPAIDMELRFQATLRNYKDAVQNETDIRLGFWTKLYQQLTTRPAFQFCYSVLLVLTGTAISYFFLKPPAIDNARQELGRLSEEIRDLKQMMMLSLIQNPSAVERMKAVSFTRDIDKVDNKIINALLTTLDEDPNVNVRLVALDALVKYSHIPQVREGLLQSISIQESPLLQAALADVMLRLGEKKSIAPLQELLKTNGAGNPAKPTIEKVVTKLHL